MRLSHKTFGLVLGHWVFVRNERAGSLLENFFISTVVSILVIRLYLRLAAGTPATTQLTIRVATESTVADLHFAHVLWGGLLMLAALVLALTFLSRSARELTAILGGIGFGAFIDELGKFITGDNNYFFQPSIALIYLTLVLLFIFIRVLLRPRPLSHRDALANALEVAKLSVIRDAAPEDRSHALGLLARWPSPDPVGDMVRQALQHMEGVPQRQPHVLERAKKLLNYLYQRLARTWWFPIAVVAFFVFQSVGSLYETLSTITWSEALAAWLGASILAVLVLYVFRHRSSPWQALASVGIILMALLVASVLLIYQREPPPALGDWLKPVPLNSDIEAGTGFSHRLIDLIEVIQLISPLISNVLAAFGILLIWHSRLAAYRLFHHAILVSILLTQFFVFYEDQFLGVIGLLPNLLILATLRYLIRAEELEAEKVTDQTTPLPHPTEAQDRQDATPSYPFRSDRSG
jgi:hypothetical protein